MPNSQYSYRIKTLIGKYLINVDHRKRKTTVCRPVKTKPLLQRETYTLVGLA